MPDESLDAFLRRGTNYNGREPEDYDETHINGRYVGSSARQDANTGYTTLSSSGVNVNGNAAQNGNAEPVRSYHADNIERELNNRPNFVGCEPPQANGDRVEPPLKQDNFISPRTYQNILLYSPRTASDVAALIDFLRRREPAIINLDPICDLPDAQRVLDYTSGAVYALGGSIEEIGSNRFLVVPDGVEISKSDK